MKIIGIDPGKHGAVAIYDAEKRDLVAIFDLPTRKQGKGGSATGLMVCPLQLRSALTPYITPGTVAAVEVAIIKPPQKLTAARTIGLNYGILLATLAMLGVGVREMAPHEWKKRLGLDDDKAASTSLAISLYPTHIESLSKRHDRAEAALIARAAMLDVGGSLTI